MSRSELTLPKSPSLDPTAQMIKELVRQRGTLKGRLTKLSLYVNSFDDVLDRNKRVELKLRMQGAANLLTEFNEIQIKLDGVLPESEQDEQLEERDSFESKYYSILAQANCMLDDDVHTNQNLDTTNCDVNLQSVKLPTISLPTFDGSYEQWLEFKNTYLSLVHNSQHITNIQKFHYLKSSLKGPAQIVINSLEFTSDNYFIAWELLMNRYNNNRLLVQNHIKALFTVPMLTKESPVLLRKIIDNVLKNIRSLKLLGEPTEHWDTLIIYLLVSKLDDTTEREWEKYRSDLVLNDSQNNSKARISVDDLLQFLKARADMLETLQNKFENKKNTKMSQNTNKIHCNISTSNYKIDKNWKRSCSLCGANHPLYSCQKFLELTVENKINFIIKSALCHNCLRPGHKADACRYGPCRKCNVKHNTLIHRELASTEDSHTEQAQGARARDTSHSSQQSTQMQSYSSQVNNSTVRSAHASSVEPVLLSTAQVRITDDLGNYVICRVLLDSGSQCCFIRKSICDKIKPQILQSCHKILGIGNSVTQSFHSCLVNITSLNGDYSTRLKCLVLPRITPKLATIPIGINKINIPSGIELADPSYLDCHDIDILIGADHFWDLLSEGKVQLDSGPVLQNTKLGWIISGPIYNQHNVEKIVHCNFSQTVDAQLRKFWELEEIPCRFDTRSEVEQACEVHFLKNTKRNSVGRFIVSIPFKESPKLLGESYTQAHRRFISLEKRLQRTPKCKAMYTEFIHEYIRLGHMERVDRYSDIHYFMPHFCVFNENSTTTKLRVVFDASARTSSNKSLNDLQMVGPPIQGDLMAILLRFRENTYVACADIQHMYRNVNLVENERDLQLIVWRDEQSAPLDIYRLNTVTYGTASAPFLSVRCLRQLAVESTDFDVKTLITRDFYVDDLVTSLNNKDDLLELCKKTTQVLAGGCFLLRKWVFNFECNNFTLSNNNYKELSLGEQTQPKTLGLGWLNKTDELNYHSKIEIHCTKITKRVILSTIAQIFDPLGLLSPTIMIMKILLQELWSLKIDWDSELPIEIVDKFYVFLRKLSELNKLRIPRHVMCVDPTHVGLHIFTDASQKAYGACAYVRSQHSDKIIIRLLSAKGKVAPLKSVTIPRLELCAALTGARLCEKIIDSLRCKFDEVVLWTDSTIVLGWLRMAPNQLKTFVQNRTAEIQELTKTYSWRHVSTVDNPADLLSRGLDLPALQKSSLWWNGPPFLLGTLQPQNHELNIEDITLPDIKKEYLNSFVSHDINKDIYFPFSRFSQFSRMQRTAAYVLRFVHNARKCYGCTLTGALSVDELREATHILARWSQRESFIEYPTLIQNKQLSSHSNLNKLNVFMDCDKLIRVGGRLSNSTEFSYNKKHPILLSAKHRFTYLLFLYKHKELMHAAPQLLLFTIRESWWPLGGRNLAKQIVHGCVVCVRHSGKTIAPIMGNLPAKRLQQGFAFEITGVDYFGPLFILNRKGRGAKLIKAYGCLFICFATRAIHLELVGDLSTEHYLLALKRFFSRRGKPTEIFSDNGRNFVGLMKEFSKFISDCAEDVKEFAIKNSVKFSFIPPYAPHFGGLWEAGVKSCKHHLKRVVGNMHLTFEEMSTTLSQIESILNSRPLTALSTDPNDYSPLTPAHFLVGRPLTAPACQDCSTEPIHRLSRYQRVEQARQHFWTRWSKEFISELQTRCKWSKTSESLAENTLVLIKEDGTPPLQWRMGRIVQVHPGKDGVARVADVRIAPEKIIRRAFSKICPLPVTSTLEVDTSKVGGMSTHGV